MQLEYIYKTRGYSLIGRTLSGCLAALLMLPIAASATTLVEAVGTAIKIDPRITASQADSRAAALDIREAQAGYYPEVDLNSGFGREKSNIKSLHEAGLDNRYLNRREFGLRLNQMVFDGLFIPSCLSSPLVGST